MNVYVLLLNRRSDSTHDMHFNLSYITPERHWVKVSDLIVRYSVVIIII